MEKVHELFPVATPSQSVAQKHHIKVLEQKHQDSTKNAGAQQEEGRHELAQVERFRDRVSTLTWLALALQPETS